MSSALLLSNIAQVPVTFFDTETTGLYPDCGDRIVEIAMVRTRAGQIEKTFDTLVYPDRAIPEDASRVSGITDAMVWGKPRFQEIVDRICEMAEGSVLVAHNAPFDLGFLAVQFGEAQRPMLKNLVLDTLLLARRCYKLPDYSLGGLAKALRVEKETFHRALGDTVMTHRLFQQMAAVLRQKKLNTVGHLVTFQGGSARPSIAQPRGAFLASA
ncbi:MAG: 3'-5' exonuclease [Armatimonadetes bacterium]|nr:3'-5' exonuclease [Armatimonadota bacterium]